MSTSPTANSSINWPEDLRPENAPVHTRNEIMIDASPEAIWPVLIRATEWSDWYPNCVDLRIVSGGDRDLGPAVEFNWKTFGVRVHTRITEYEHPGRLTWRGGAAGTIACHAWLLMPTKTGCLVITEEVQRGPVPFMGRIFLRRALLKQHGIWLEGLKRVVEN